MEEAIVPIKPEVVIKVIECGPLRIGGALRIMLPHWKMIFQLRAFMVPVWEWVNQPFCEGSHAKR